MKKSKDVSARRNFKHFGVLVTRYFRQILLSRGTMISLILQAPIMLLIVSLVYRAGCFSDPEQALTANTTVFVLVLVPALMGILNSYREICKEREILNREVFGGLDVTSYVFSKLFVLAVVGLIQCVLFVLGSLTFIDFNLQKPILDIPLYLASVFLTNLAVTALGLWISAMLRKSESAILPVLLVIIMQVVFSDVVIPIDGAAKALLYVTPTMWGTAVLGNRFRLNDLLLYSTQASYDWNPLFGLLALIGFVLLFTLLTVLKLRHDYRSE